MHHIARFHRLRHFAADFFLICQRLLRLLHLFFHFLNLVLLCAARFFHGPQFGNHGFRFPFGIFNNAFGLVLRFADRFFPLIFELFLFRFSLIANGNHFIARLFCQFALLFGDLPMIFRICNHVFKTDLLFGKQFFRSADNEFRQTKLPRNFKCIGFARNANGQSIGRSERRNIKLNRCIFHIGRCQRIFLEFAVMRRCNGARVHIQQRRQHSLRQRRAFCRVCSRTQFIKEHQRFRRNVLQNRNNVRHMSRKCGE